VAKSFVNHRGLRICFIGARMAETLKDSLYDYAEGVGKTPSECIREAVGEYLWRKKACGRPVSGAAAPWLSNLPEE